MTTVEIIQALRRDANQIRSLFKIKIPTWKADSSYDKTGWGFNIDDRFSACGKIEIWFSSWMGVYGSSGSSSQLNLNKGTFGEHLVKYLNNHQEEIMLAIADSIEQEAKGLKEKAKGELEAKLKDLNELDEV